MRYCLLLFLTIQTAAATAQPVVYTDAITLITGTWAEAGSGGAANLQEVMGQTPHEGAKHYRFDYNFQNWWAGIGLNMDQWGAAPARNFSGYSHLRIAYRGLAAGQTLTLTLRDGNQFGNAVEIGGAQGNYTVVDLSLFALTAGTQVSPVSVREINLSIGSSTQAGGGTLYFDAIELVNLGGGPAAATPATLARASALGLGVNTSNWLEAYWLQPFGAYPEINRYTRAKVQALRNAGFTTFRLPVIFERLGSTTPPYELNFNQVAFDLVDSMILWANLYDYKLIIDNHHGYPLTNANYQTELPRLQAVWQQLTERYDDLDPARFFFEIYNEPTNEISNANWRNVAIALLATIRDYETQTHSVLVGANQWNSGNTLLSFTPLPDPDVIYTFHNYDPYFFTHQGMSWTSPPYFPPRSFPLAGEVADIQQLFAAVDTWGDNYAVPVNLGEFGCSTQADAASRCNWIQTLTSAINTHDLSHFYWDAISPSDAFGFYDNGIIDQAHCIPCFETALNLYAALPVSVSQVVLDCDEKQPVLSWIAEITEEACQFEIQKSVDGQHWRTINTLEGRPEEKNYRWADPSGGEGFYRLKVVLPDGTEQISPIRKNICRPEMPLVIAPNPANYFAILQSGDARMAIEYLSMSDLSGRVLWERHFGESEWVEQYTLPAWQFPAGTYLIQVRSAEGRQWIQRFNIVR